MENERQDNLFSATDERAPVAFSNWTQKLRFDRSFTAKLILSDETVKNFYADLASELLKYEKVKSKTGWSGVSFQAGRERIAFIAVTGKTLYLYLAIAPESISSGKYKAKDVSAVKKRAKTPALFKIKSEGAKKHALKLIGECASSFGLTLKKDDTPLVLATNFKADSFNNLITRGLIRIVRTNTNNERGVSVVDGQENRARGSGVYDDTVDTINSLLSRHGIYNEILTVLSEGEGRAKLSQKFMLRSVDEIWVKAIEDCISSLDELIRNPKHIIAETEEVLAIEKTKRISARSIAHLCRHTDYISVKENGDITPTKMLNVFRDDSLLTYENKFLNTLIHRLYMFVSKRYKVAKEYGMDEKLESFEFENDFTHGEGKGKIKISIEYSERNLETEVKNTLLGTGLWSRVERLNDIVTAYVNSSFAKSMERNFVHPPIMRTNAIIKNKYFRECLALWEFIESYDDAGYGITVEEKVQEMSDEYVKTTYAGAAMQYLLFRRNLKDGFEEEDLQADDESFSVRPDFILSLARTEKYTEDFVFEKNDEPTNDDLDLALRVALLADEQIKDGEEEAYTTFAVKTFHAKLRLADDVLKENFAQIGNELLAYGKVKMRHSMKYVTFTYGRQVLARITVNGKSIKFFTALSLANIPEKFNAIDVSDKKSFADTPVCIKIRSKRSMKYAKELIDMLANQYALTLSDREIPEIKASDYKKEPLVDMIEKGWISFAKRANVIDAFTSFGPSKKLRTTITAEDVRRLSVAEPIKNMEDVRITEIATTDASRVATEEGRIAAKRIAGLIRPSGNYEKPTEYGIDDVSEFIKDIAEKAKEDDSDRK